MEGLFPIDEKFLFAIMRLEDSPTNGADWKIIKDKFEEVSKAMTDQNLHSPPDYRLNYSERHHTFMGFCMALDVIKNIFSNASQLREELKEQDEFLEAQERARQEQGEVTG